MRVLFLLFVLVVGGFGEEIDKVPRIERGPGLYYSAILAPNGKSFYTLKNNLITQWQLKPVKRLDSFRVDIKRLDKKYMGYNIHVTTDQTKMVINSKYEILLWDLKAKRLIKRVKLKTAWGLMKDSIFITIDDDRVVTKWDTKSLNKIQSVQLDDLCVKKKNAQCYNKPIIMMSYKSKLVCFYEDYLLFLDIDSLEVIKFIDISGFSGFSAVSLDHKFIFYHIPHSYTALTKINIDTTKITRLPEIMKFYPYVKNYYYNANLSSSFISISSYYKYLSLG